MLATESSDFINPDYNYSVLTVYTNTAYTFMQRDGVLDILHFSGGYPVTNIDPFDLPSWVPNWNISQEVSGLIPGNYCAAGQTRAMIRFHPESSQLLVPSVVHGRIC